MSIRWIVVFSLGLAACQVNAKDAPMLKTQQDKVSYSIGRNIGENLKKQPIDINQDALAAGIKDALSEGKSLLTDEEVRKVLNEFQQEMRVKAETRMNELGEKNKKEGEAFLAANKKKDGVITLPSGLQYKVITEGDGKIPKASDTVTTHYRGTLMDGTEFDSSLKRGEPSTFPVGGVIAGWTEALQLMKVGSKWQLFIPSDLAYGVRGAGQMIGPHASLIFEVELLSIKDEKQ